MALSEQAPDEAMVSRADVMADLEGLVPGVLKAEVAEIIAEVQPLRLVSALNAFKKVEQESLIPEGGKEVFHFRSDLNFNIATSCKYSHWTEPRQQKRILKQLQMT
jgi:hypothetical protein